MTDKGIVNDVIAVSPNRRSFAKKLGLAGAFLGMAATPKAVLAQSATISDVDILNFALNLEYLEAEFYNIATSGLSVDQLGVNIYGSSNIGASTGGRQVTFTDNRVRQIAVELAANELEHIIVLQRAIYQLGGQPIARPPINLNALGFGFGSQVEFLRLARIFEDIGVTAYGGAAPLISSKAVLATAARILAVEAVHSGNLRLLLAQFGITSPTLDGADVPPPPSGFKYAPTNGQALTAVRTPQQVLFLAYGAPNATKGGFFPNSVNGNINTSAAAGATIDGPTITATPNPVQTGGSGYGATTISWNAPNSSLIQIRVNSPGGTLFTYNAPTGSMQTAAWVTNGTTLYLQDATSGDPTKAANTLATLVIYAQ